MSIKIASLGSTTPNSSIQNMDTQPGSWAEWYTLTAPELSGAGLWLRGGEWNTLDINERENRSLRVLISRLSTYADTSESFTHPLLYQTLASMDDIYPDLAYLPPPKDGEVMCRDGVPWLLGSQSKYGPDGFDVIALSNAIVQELVNLPSLLQYSGILLSESERLEREDIPLLLLGGANSFHASLLDRPNSPIDGIFAGEDLKDIQELFELLAEGKRLGLNKEKRLESLLQIPGFYRPGRAHLTKKRNRETLDLRFLSAARPLLYRQKSLGLEPVALSRGCPAFCSFCAESFDLKPYRENPKSVVHENALKLRRETGIEGVDLFSFNFNFYEELMPLLEEMSESFAVLGLKSQRFDVIARDSSLLPYLRAVGKSSFTFGMEGISARLRRYLQKGLEEDELWRALRAVFNQGVRELKIFLITTGLEEEEDFEEYQSFLQRLKTIGTPGKGRGRIILSSTPLVRFPATPLEFADAFDPETLARIARRLGHLTRVAGWEWREAAEEPETYVSQVLARSDDPRYWDALCEAVQKTGFIYRSAMDEGFMRELHRSLESRGLDSVRVLGGYDFEASKLKPWARFDMGVKREFLWRQYRKAEKWKDPGYCLGSINEKAHCLACDACETPEETEWLTRKRIQQDSDSKRFLNRLSQLRKESVQITFSVTLDAKCHGLPRKYPAQVLVSSILQELPDLSPLYRNVSQSQFGPLNETCWWIGEEMFTLEWKPEAKALLEEAFSDPDFLERLGLRLQGWISSVTLLLEAQRDNSSNQRFAFVSPFEVKPESYLRTEGLKATYSKGLLEETELSGQEGHLSQPWKCWLLSPESVRKKMLSKIKYREVSPNEASLHHGKESVFWMGEIEAGSKFHLESFLSSAFDLKLDLDWTRIICSRLP